MRQVLRAHAGDAAPRHGGARGVVRAGRGAGAGHARAGARRVAGGQRAHARVARLAAGRRRAAALQPPHAAAAPARRYATALRVSTRSSGVSKLFQRGHTFYIHWFRTGYTGSRVVLS